MTEKHADTNGDFAALQAVRKPEVVEDANAADQKPDEAAYAEFREKFQAGQCSFCDGVLTSFDAAKPCRHWLLKPAGVEKKHIEELGKKYGWGTLENYLRWVANEGAFARNINDLADEATGKLLELTIKYKNLQWSFSCGSNDLDGHNSEVEASKAPHYHFQMYVDDKPFVRYNDYHLPLTTGDVEYLSLMRKNPRIKRAVVGGTGMNDVLQGKSVEELASLGRSAETDEEAKDGIVRIVTFMEAKSPKGMRVEDVLKAAREARVATIGVRNLDGVKADTVAYPGPGVVRQAPRSGRNNKKLFGEE